MLWGCSRWGEIWGAALVKDLTSFDLASDPPAALIEWLPTDGAPAAIAWQVYIDAKLVGVTYGTETSLVIALEDAGEFQVNVMGVSPETAFVDNSDCIKTLLPPGDRVKLVWQPSKKWGQFEWGDHQWGLTEAVNYNVYWDEGLGGVFTLLGTTSLLTWTTDQLQDGSYKFRVDPVDAAGNVLTSSVVETVVIDRPPDAVTDLVMTVFVDPASFTLEWTPSASSDVTEYRVYDNGGSGAIDYTTVIATIAAPAAGGTYVRAPAASVGSWLIAVRAYDGTYEEANVNVLYGFDIVDIAGTLTALPLQPTVPSNVTAVAVAGGSIKFTMDYYAGAEDAFGDDFLIYSDGGTGTIDFSTSVGTISIPAHDFQQPVPLSATVTIGPLIDGTTYLFAVKSKNTTTGRESDASATVTARADATPPSDLFSLTGTVVYGTPLTGT